MAVIGVAILAWCASRLAYQDLALTPLWAPKAHLLYTGLALLFAPLMIAAPAIKWLASATLVWIGRISYGLYMWHLLAFVICERLALSEWGRHVAGVMLTFVVAGISWYAFERPILTLKDDPRGWRNWFRRRTASVAP